MESIDPELYIYIFFIFFSSRHDRSWPTDAAGRADV